MKTFKVCFFSLLIGLFVSTFLGCQQKQANEIKVGTIVGPETKLMEVAKKVAKDRYDLNIVIIPFNDYTMPNIALNDDSIDANMFQTIPYFEADVKTHGYNFAIVGKTFIYPMGIYSQKFHSLAEIPNKAIVAIPNDPSNETRALLLLEKANLIKLKPNKGDFLTPLDIQSNPKNLQFEQLDAAILPRVLPDVSLAVINTNYAVPAGLYPSKDSIFMEDRNSPYANIIVTKKEKADDPKIKNLVLALQSPEVLEAAKILFKGQALPSWQ